MDPSTAKTEPAAWRQDVAAKMEMLGKRIVTASPKGARYEALVPDTLDLADRGRYSLNAILGMPEIGWVPLETGDSSTETCCIAGLIMLAVKLSEHGVGDYWDDVDRFVRNQIVENQLIRQGTPRFTVKGLKEKDLTVDVGALEPKLHLTAKIHGADASLVVGDGKKYFTARGSIESVTDAGTVGLLQFLSGGATQYGLTLQRCHNFRVIRPDWTLIFKDDFSSGPAEGIPIPPPGWEMAGPLTYRTYLRDHMRGDKASLVKRTRFAPAGSITTG